MANGHFVPVLHEWPNPVQGMTWFFCPAHREYHAMFLLEGALQPFCGECAVLFYDRCHLSVWLRRFDIKAVSSNSTQMWMAARNEMDDLLQEISSATRRLSDDTDADSNGDLTPSLSILYSPPDPESINSMDSALAEIPKDDCTYRHLSTTLVPHTRIPNVWLLEYLTFQGAFAYQPCCKDIDTTGLLTALLPIDQAGDPIFKQARTWSCIVQALPRLPKELRWLLVTVYDFSNEMLQPGTAEDVLWKMRPWLMHWYSVADELFYYFGISASSPPEVDWFLRPCHGGLASGSSQGVSAWSSMGDGKNSEPNTSEPQSSAGETVVIRRDQADGRFPLWAMWAQGIRGHGQPDSRATMVDSWLASQPNTIGVGQASGIFDPTPRGFVFSGQGQDSRGPLFERWRANVSAANVNGDGRGHAHGPLQLNPRAPTFEPRHEQRPFEGDSGFLDHSGVEGDSGFHDSGIEGESAMDGPVPLSPCINTLERSTLVPPANDQEQIFPWQWTVSR
ncbi:hypothetical protein CDD82_7810 [Ophiocordyceps australis]|uniref:Uncharacterized protein n=1 Tax=Ophiocordyceps australis TaxID=1399860 RepID=A0A2C5XTY7_9HYPO|nr:hypothetical protein CDD82_7810 [Ophiocordyceps australis]